jgi:ATP-binding cassette subfamily B protein/subfamily B ATP-binding cassette protein MsbA
MGVGNALRRITTDSECMSTIVQDTLLPVSMSLVSLVAMFVVMVELDPTLTLLALLVLPAMAVTIKLYSRPMLERSYEQHTAEGKMYDTVEQTLTALPVIQAFAAEERADARFQSDTDRILRATIATTWAQFRFKILIGAATSLGTTLVLYVGTEQALSGALTVGTMVVFISYLASLYGPLEDVMQGSGSIQGAAGSARRILEILDAPSEVEDSSKAIALSAVRGHLRFENVTFGYEPGQPVLRGVSLEARPGRIVAIVGATGAGKTTLVSLIPRFFDPDDGRVTMDGQDLRELKLKTVRGAVSLVLQDSFLFPFSIAENIAYGRPNASRAEVEDAARAANAHAFISRLPDGYDTVVGERGATLSGGERQRVAIARALLRDAPVLILDEPTSALDAETESLLLEALDRLMLGRTTLIIAHRLSTIRAADEIIVLDHGKIIERGNHEALLRHGGAYARLHAIQTGRTVASTPRRGRLGRVLARRKPGYGS